MSDLIGRVKELYAAFGRGDIATILASLANDVSWELEGPAELAAAGIRRSPKEVIEFFGALAGQVSDIHLDLTEFLSGEDTVAVFGRYQGTVRANGIRIDSPIAHFFKFNKDGKIMRHVQLSDTAATVEAIRGRAAAAAT